MKKKFLLVALLSAFSMYGFTQQMALPQDGTVRVGKLDNGLTYYIRHNDKPEHRAEFYIAQKVGSVLEEEPQRGLAHFLEHMAFNGTKNYPGKNMLDYLEKNGIKFGTNINAGTGIDQTVYMIKDVPTANKGLLDSCLLVLHDWSSFILLEEDEIDKERGVILEELRSRDGADQRLMEKTLPIMYPDCNYGNRLPGGLPEVVANFEYQTLRDYYHKWYRPDLQGIIVVGDIDVDETEARIKEMFSDIKAPVNPTPRPFIEVADNTDPIVAVATDPEATNYQMMLFYKQDVWPQSEKNSIEYFMVQYIFQMISDMMNNRLSELIQSANPPFTYAYAYYTNYYVAPTKDSWMNVMIPMSASGINDALTAMIHENSRMVQYGFTASEYERAKADFMKQIESKYNDRDNEKNESYVSDCLMNFLQSEPMLGIENEYMLYNQLVPYIPLEAINQVAQQLVTPNNMVLCVTGPDVEPMPSEKDLLAIMEKAENDAVEPYQETVSDEPLLAKAPKAGSVKKESKNNVLGTTEWTLSNGVKVVFKPTEFKKDEIQMNAFRFGGTSTMDLKDAVTVRNLDQIITLGGVGNFSATELPKVLAGKKVTVTPYIRNYREGISGSSTPKDLETMLQLVYLYFTDNRYDQTAFQSYITRTTPLLESVENQPLTSFSDSVVSITYNNHPFAVRTKASQMKDINYEKGMELYKQHFSNAMDFTFTFSGNIDPDTFKPLVEQYLGSLPTGKNVSKIGKNVMSFSKGSKNCSFEKNMENPTTTIYIVYSGDMQYNLKNDIYMTAFGNIMDIVYTATVREEEGGTYGVSTYGTTDKYPSEHYGFQIVFQTNSDVKDKLMGIVKDELTRISTEGPDPVNLQKTKDYMLKHHEELKQENSYWNSLMDAYYCEGEDFLTDYEKIVNSITVESMRDFAKKVISQDEKDIIQVGVK